MENVPEISEFGKQYGQAEKKPWFKFSIGKEKPLPPLPSFADDGDIADLRRMVVRGQQEHDEEMSAVMQTLNRIEEKLKITKEETPLETPEKPVEPLNTSNNGIIGEGVAIHILEQTFSIERKDVQYVIDTTRKMGIVIASAGFVFDDGNHK